MRSTSCFFAALALGSRNTVSTVADVERMFMFRS